MALSNYTLSTDDKARIERAIKLAESNTSGEIRFFIEDKCKGEVLDRASFVFARLEMHKTELRNGVLFYLSTSDRQFAILGDAGINAKVPTDFWETVKNSALSFLKDGEIAAGIAQGIDAAGEKLQAFFPYQSNDINELSDEVVEGLPEDRK
jgi:uncharacterized membrane protein